MDIFKELARKVDSGETTWDEILFTIKEIRKYDYYANLDAKDYLVSAIEKDTLSSQIASGRVSAFNLVYRKNLYESLSKHAKEVIEIVLPATPFDWRVGHYGREIFSETRTPGQYNIVKSKIRVLLKRLGWNTRDIDRTFNELRKYCNEIEQYA